MAERTVMERMVRAFHQEWNSRFFEAERSRGDKDPHQINNQSMHAAVRELLKAAKENSSPVDAVDFLNSVLDRR